MIGLLHRSLIPAALSLLPAKFDTPAARALLLAIALQESRCAYRRQMGQGPARGFFQFELHGGVLGVLTHPYTLQYLRPVLLELCYPPAATACYEALEHNDILAIVFARLLLYSVPGSLAQEAEVERAWAQYLYGWRPGAFTRGSQAEREQLRTQFGQHFARAWAMVNGTAPAPAAAVAA